MKHPLTWLFERPYPTYKEYTQRLKTELKIIKAKGFDGRGNFTFGIKEQLVFPEIVIDDVKNINGMDITIVTSANTDEEAKALLSEFGFPFKN